MTSHDAALTAAPLPAGLGRLRDLAFNLWWSWWPDAGDLFRRIDPEAWEASKHNPVRLLREAPVDRLAALAADSSYLALYHQVCGAFDRYMASGADTWYGRTYPGDDRLIAYFCAEYGLHASVPIYAGGLGVLAGDHCKAASDLGLPLVAIGLWYTQGYFAQSLDAEGRQLALAEIQTQGDVPLQFAGEGGADLRVRVDLPDRVILARVWRLQVGRVPLYLLDTDLPENAPADTQLCARLYGGGRETRLAQELVLGIGGVKALRALGLAPTVWHMNEGHAAFSGLERMRALVESGLDFTDAWPAVAASTIFTTHTPVPAGNETFREELVRAYLPGMPAGLGLDWSGFLALAHEEGAPDGTFAMTPLALRLAHRANGVSKLHGAVARGMWAKQFPDRPADGVPITSITNGVHTDTWVAPALGALYARALGEDWLSRVDDPALWDGVARIADRDLWDTHTALKRRLLSLITGGSRASDADLAPLTIGFARRFATYKRATLFFHDLERAARLLNDARRPMRLIFAGKAHPADGGGQALIKSIVELASDESFAGKVIFLEDYDMALAGALVQGVDLWLNNPERPQEASGTSGQKASLNGVPNCSIRDGWWDEAFNGRNGWAFGGEVGDDDVDSAQLYEVLEGAVIPAYYERDADGLPGAWIAVMKEAIRTVAPAFSATRMVKEYTERLYR